MSSATLHVVTAEEAVVLELRAAALRRFNARYRHRPESQRAMTGALHRIASVYSDGQLDERTFPWEILVDDDLTAEVWSFVAAYFSRKTAVRDASALRVMLDCCRRVGLLTHEQYRRASSFETKNGGRHRPPAGHYLNESALGQIVETTWTGSGNPETRTRDAALLLFMACSGVRLIEVANVQTEHTDLDERRVLLEITKGGEPRYAWLHPGAVEWIGQWLQIRGTAPGPLWVPLSRVGRPMPEHGAISGHQIWKIVRRRSAEAGYPGITPHDLRRFLITALLPRFDLALVAGVVGHASTVTTQAYDRRPAEAQRAAVASLNLPRLSTTRTKP